jgi:small subunit ribosomal protein S16
MGFLNPNGDFRESLLRDGKIRRNSKMVRLRLRRIGLKGQPTYRVIAADSESPRDGRFLEILGFYNPRTQPATIRLKEDRVYHWMKNGALPTESVEKVFKSAGVMDRWERFKKGEAVETLLKEAEQAETIRGASAKTSK